MRKPALSRSPALAAVLSLILLACAPVMAWAQGKPAPVAGQDYEVIADGKPFAPVKGKIEVAEVFSYACVHCAHFEPRLQTWKRRQPRDVQLTQVPAALSSSWLPFARAYYAAESAGVLAQSHAAVFTALHETGALPMHNPSVDELADFYVSFGTDRNKFAALLRSDAVGEKVERAKRFAMDAGVTGTPTLVVAGKYRVTGGSTYDEVLAIVDWLVARERASARK
ncbi:MAG TPA: thiol:disulfide interchange protein DsbA/DsbL [Pseudoxanthomonas sp.]|jgi:thiol:disulfide interchange protein DsbA|nr:thiol:disulfide interchange protein DsbA/DsbL [Pseudoxanthomonas sp.]